MSAARWTTAVVIAACVVARAMPAAAHPGGHAATPGTTLRVWTDPESGRPMPGSLLFVADGLARVRQGRIEAVLLDLNLPDSLGLTTFLRFQPKATQVPIVVVVAAADDDIPTEREIVMAPDDIPF